MRLASMVALVAALLACSAGCGSPDGRGVALTIRVAGSVDDAQLAQVKRLRVSASGDEQQAYLELLSRGMAREERLIYRPAPSTTHLALTVEALDETGAPVAAGQTDALTLSSGLRAASVELGATDLAGTTLLEGGEGDDVLVGGAGGWVRSPQLERWRLAGAADLAEDMPTRYVAFKATADVGWTLVTTPDVVEGLATGGPLEYNVARSADRVGIDSPETRLGHFVVDTSSSGDGVWLAQAVPTAPGGKYELVVQLADPIAFDGQCLEVRGAGKTLASFSGAAGKWTGVVPQPVGANRIQLSFVVTAMEAHTLIELRTFGPPSTVGAYLDFIKLTPLDPPQRWAVVGHRGPDLMIGDRDDDVLWGGAQADSSATADGVVDTFVYSFWRPNGNDVIEDFQVGVDRLVFTDVSDTYNFAAGVARSHLDFGGWDPATAPDASRFPGVPVSAGDVQQLVTDGDYNLGFQDLQSLDQRLTPGAAADGSLKLQIFGVGGVSLGSVTLKGVPYATVAGADDAATLRTLMGGSGYVDPAVPNPSPTPRILYLTLDAFHDRLAAELR